LRVSGSEIRVYLQGIGKLDHRRREFFLSEVTIPTFEKFLLPDVRIPITAEENPYQATEQQANERTTPGHK
jgi:hypothetical protein